MHYFRIARKLKFIQELCRFVNFLEHLLLQPRHSFSARKYRWENVCIDEHLSRSQKACGQGAWQRKNLNCQVRVFPCGRACVPWPGRWCHVRGLPAMESQTWGRKRQRRPEENPPQMEGGDIRCAACWFTVLVSNNRVRWRNASRGHALVEQTELRIRWIFVDPSFAVNSKSNRILVHIVISRLGGKTTVLVLDKCPHIRSELNVFYSNSQIDHLR